MTYPAIMHREPFESFVLSLPAVTLVRQWRDDSVAKIGGKVFCLLDQDPGEIWLKVSPMSFSLMIEVEGIRPAPYFARAGWVAISHRSPLTEQDICAYIVEARRLVAANLSKRLPAELGLIPAQ
ncbi:MmcQ/YjbR family DNA-binding protein [Devosia sp. MC1541]|uniref:MmcQ/YjbR family DNA-binding protein n=1 Tax=Devosia sp. MC1541 TaxID=2725264 RepID=UPI00145F2AA4